jgi:hypothetical protein
VVLRPKELEMKKKCENCIRPENKPKYEMEPNQSKHRAMHEGDDPLI